MLDLYSGLQGAYNQNKKIRQELKDIRRKAKHAGEVIENIKETNDDTANFLLHNNVISKSQIKFHDQEIDCLTLLKFTVIDVENFNIEKINFTYVRGAIDLDSNKYEITIGFMGASMRIVQGHEISIRFVKCPDIKYHSCDYIPKVVHNLSTRRISIVNPSGYTGYLNGQKHDFDKYIEHLLSNSTVFSGTYKKLSNISKIANRFGLITGASITVLIALYFSLPTIGWVGLFFTLFPITYIIASFLIIIIYNSGKVDSIYGELLPKDFVEKNKTDFMHTLQND